MKPLTSNPETARRIQELHNRGLPPTRIAEKVGVQRSSVIRLLQDHGRYQPRVYRTPVKDGRKTWTEPEVDRMVEMRDRDGMTWPAIALALSVEFHYPQRSPSACAAKYYMLLRGRP